MVRAGLWGEKKYEQAHPNVRSRPRIQDRTASWTLLWEHLDGHDIGSQVGLHPVFAGLRVNLNRFLRA